MMARNGLRLKAELIAKAVEAPTGDNFLAKVWVDSGVLHLDGEYSYLIPGNLSKDIAVGSFVDVPFNGRELTATVIARQAWSGEVNLKSIAGIQGRSPLLNSSQISLIQRLSAKYISHPFDLIRSIVPARMVSVEKNRPIAISANGKSSNYWSNKKQSCTYLQLPPYRDRDALIANKLIDSMKEGPTLALFPDIRSVDAISRQLIAQGVNFARYDSSQSRGDHYSSYLNSLEGQSDLVIGTRSSIFLPLLGLRNIVIYNEGSQQYYEQRSPGWNAREVALERAKSENLSLTFIGYSPSLEVCRLIEAKEVIYRKSSARVEVREYEQIFGELLPSGALQEIKRAIKLGPVLFVAPLKGWAHAIRCARCKTLSKCKCGGNFEITSEKSPITCNHCQSIANQWKCMWCENPTFALVGRGMERHAHEIGKLLPGHRILNSNSDAPELDEVANGIVVATQGMAPKALNGYSAIVFLEGNRINSAPDMRAQERMRELYFSHAGLVRVKGIIILIQDKANPIVTALRLWNPLPILERELAEREDLHLPPFTHTIELSMPKDEVTRFKSALLKAQVEGRLPTDMKILGPIVKGEESSIVLLSPPENSKSVNLLIHEFMRKRSITKKVLPSLRIDPYSLSR